MNNWIKFSCINVVMFILLGCTTSKTTVSSTADLSQYRYACIINNETYNIPAELMEYEMQLYDAVESSRLQLVSDRRIFELTQHQQKDLLLVKYGVRHTGDEAIVTVNFIDYTSDRPIVSCRGAYALGLDRGGDLRGAIKNVVKQISKTFPKK